MKTKFALRVTSLVALVLLPVIAVLAIVFLVKPQFSGTFVGELDEKYERLASIDEPKIVIVGGSSAAFGIDTETLEKATGYKVVNFGLYADLGTKIMLDLSERHINKGDIVIIAPEVDAQTLSLFFNGETALKALDDKPSMLFSLKLANFDDLWGGLWPYMTDKLYYRINGTPVISEESIYRSDVFDEYGDIDPTRFPREGNVMTFGYDTTKEIVLECSTYDDAFIDYVNRYTKKIERRGATVYYTFCPLNRDGVRLDKSSDLSKDEQLAALSASLLNDLKDAFDCEILGSPADSLMDPLYFYDTNFHLNDAGVLLFTGELADRINATKNKTTQHYLEGMRTEGALYQDEYLIYRRQADGSYKVCDTTSLMNLASCLLVPATVTNEAGTALVSGVEVGALDDCRRLDTIVFASGSAMTTLSEACFAELSNLVEVYLYDPLTSLTDLVEGCTFSYQVPEAHKNGYLTAEGFASVSHRVMATDLAEAEMCEIVDILLTEHKEQMANALKTSDAYFRYEQLADGTFMITGLTDLGKTQRYLVIPAHITIEGEEYDVVMLAPNAFADSKATALVVPSDATLHDFANYVFVGSSIRDLYLYPAVTSFGTISGNMIAGVPQGFAIHIYGEASMSEYKADYSWNQFGPLYRLNSLTEAQLVEQLSK